MKPEAATAVVELLMMGGRTPETWWAVNKRQDNKLENCCIWLVIYLNCTMMHGLTNLKYYLQVSLDCITLPANRITDTNSVHITDKIHEADPLLYEANRHQLTKKCRAIYKTKNLIPLLTTACHRQPGKSHLHFHTLCVLTL